MFSRILVPFDGSEAGTAALWMAVGFASGREARVRVLHILERPAALDGAAADRRTGTILEALREQGRQVVSLGKQLVQRASVPADAMLVDRPCGGVGEQVAEAASQWRADLIVVGARGRTPHPGRPLGHAAEQILRLAPVAVLVTPGRRGGGARAFQDQGPGAQSLDGVAPTPTQ
jgi:nucleotide-binding universal stress UspA family protein